VPISLSAYPFCDGEPSFRHTQVSCIPDRFLRYAAPGNYKIIGAMPDRDGDRVYRIKSPLEEHERVVTESLLVKSEH